MTEQQLFLFLAEVIVLVVAARIGGEVASRLRIPPVIGELVAGILLGPSLFGLAWHGGFHALFPPDPAQRNLLEIMGWVGVIFLVLMAGLETNLGLLRKAGRVLVWGWAGGFLLPFAMGFGLGMLIPSDLIGPGIGRPLFALFVATAMSISAIPVIARILMDLDLFGTKVGMVILSTAVADDTVGWIILAVISGLAVAGKLDGVSLVVAMGGTVAFLAFATLFGQRLVDLALRTSRRLDTPFAQTSVILLLVFAGGMATQAIHIHLVLGSFVVGVLIARSAEKDQVSIDAIRHVGAGFFVPFFFAFTGARVDLTTLRGATIWVAAAAVVVACVSKLVGAGVGSWLGGFTKWEAAAVGAGRNARGAMELVIAAIGLSLGIVSLAMYSIVVLIAVFTTLMAAPLLRWCVNRAEAERVPGTAPAAVPA